MDDSDDFSFFDDPEFQFAKEDAERTGKKNSTLSLGFFAPEVLEDEELVGYLFINVPKSLRAGSIFFRIETTEETFLEKKNSNETLAERLKLLREKVKQDLLVGNLNNAKSDMVRTVSPTKKNMVIPTSVNSNQRAYDPIVLRRESNIHEMVRSSYTRCILDVEAFVFDYEISRSIALVIPFRIALRGRLNRSCNLTLDNTTYLANGRKRQGNTIKKQVIEVQNNSKKINITGLNGEESHQYIKITHKFIAYYAIKNDIHYFNQVQQNLSDEERNKIRYEALQKTDYFLSSSREFKVMPNFKQMNYKKLTKRAGASVQQDNPYFLCCTKKIDLAVNICLDFFNLRDRDDSLNFVMNFDRQLIEDYMYLDVIIYSRLTHTGDEAEDTTFMENISMVQSFDLDRKLPSNSPLKMVEYVGKLDLTPIQAKYQSVSSEHVKIEYFIKFYLSSLSLRFNLEIIEIPLNFFKIGEEFRSQDADEILEKFRKIEDKIKTDEKEKAVMLPYAILDFDRNIKGNGFVIEDGLSDDDRPPEVY